MHTPRLILIAVLGCGAIAIAGVFALAAASDRHPDLGDPVHVVPAPSQASPHAQAPSWSSDPTPNTPDASLSAPASTPAAPQTQAGPAKTGAKPARARPRPAGTRDADDHTDDGDDAPEPPDSSESDPDD
ncbi:MAG TPA: hypothetical protein PKX56_00505 [Marmoricola sp.]|nr:hypothetical protein [Marmoricola sp.]HNJ77805.1 hypothetical protein [Marmoricola sp.]HNO39462.1 hypothetical protein [Marmoricola sp.]